MIENQTQYNATKEQLGKFTEAIGIMEGGGNVKNVDSRLFNAVLDGHKSMRSELQGQIDRYEAEN